MKKALIIGGTGTISTSVVDLALRKGWNISLLNRGRKPLPAGVHSIVADIHDEAAVARLIENSHYDVVAQFIGFGAEDAERDIRLFTGHTQQYIYVSSASVYPLMEALYSDIRKVILSPTRNPFSSASSALMMAGFSLSVVKCWPSASSMYPPAK